MSKISLKHSGGNVVSLNAPTSAPTSPDVAFKLPNADGTSGQVLKTDGSGNLSFGADTGGKLLQMVETTQESVVSYASASFVDLSGITATINGVTSGSKIIVDIRLMVGRAADTGIGFKLFRDSTFLPSYSGSTDTFANYIQESGGGYTYGFHNFAFRYTDLHGQSAGSNLVYKLQGTTYSSSNTLYLNRRNYDSGQRGQCSVVLMEIAP
jgi:hypothetical protein|tara:strand:- start:222 stop:851 length:630 start_codon:yes stop_codon:yes gene_type:complete